MSSRRLVVLAVSAAIAAVPVAVAVPTAAAVPVMPAGVTAPVVRSVSAVRPAAKPVNPVLRPGSKGPAVLDLQKRLGATGYWVGKPTGYFGHSTAQAVMALQKAAGLGRDSVMGPSTWKALNAKVLPTPRSTRGRVVEVDLKRQLMTFVVDGKLRFVVNTSTGAPSTPTPRGSWSIYRQYSNGWKVAPLGRLYRPKYFHNGYAIHGVPDGKIPGYPASHGCTRVSTAVMDMLWGSSGVRVGDRVWVY